MFCVFFNKYQLMKDCCILKYFYSLAFSFYTKLLQMKKKKQKSKKTRYAQWAIGIFTAPLSQALDIRQ